MKPKEKTKAINDKSDDNTCISKEIYDEILEERMDEILKMSRKINYSNLVYDFQGPTPSIGFTKFGGPMYTCNQLKNSQKTLQQVEEHQKKIISELNENTSGNPKHKSGKQSYPIKIVRNLYDSRQKIINLLNDNPKIRSEAIYKSEQNETEGTGINMLTPKKMFQRLTIALAQVKAGNNSASLLNEIRQIVYSLCQSKQNTKKVYTNIIKSIQ